MISFAGLFLVILVQQTDGFLTHRQPNVPYRSISCNMAVTLEPEPEGGEELSAFTTMPACRVKKMKELTNIKNDDGTVYEFWMTSEAEGSLIKEIRTQILKDASKKANFPGFRKGQVPPYAQPQITQFAVQEALFKTVEATLEGYGLKSIAGSDGELTVHEEVSDMSKGYQTGDSLQFTATFNGIFDPEKVRPEESEVEDVVEKVESEPELAAEEA